MESDNEKGRQVNLVEEATGVLDLLTKKGLQNLEILMVLETARYLFTVDAAARGTVMFLNEQRQASKRMSVEGEKILNRMRN